jgi:hypothetical protein
MCWNRFFVPTLVGLMVWPALVAPGQVPNTVVARPPRPTIATQSTIGIPWSSIPESERWRVVQYSGRWWYWLPNRHWTYWNGERWSEEIAPIATPMRHAPPGHFIYPEDEGPFNPVPTPGHWIGPLRPGAGWVGGFFSTGGGYGG